MKYTLKSNKSLLLPLFKTPYSYKKKLTNEIAIV